MVRNSRPSVGSRRGCHRCTILHRFLVYPLSSSLKARTPMYQGTSNGRTMRRRTDLLSLFFTAIFLALTVAACGSEHGPNEPPGDGRPDGTVRNRFVLASICDLSFGEGVGELYSDFRVRGGELLETQPIVDRELNFYLKPDIEGHELVVKVGGNEVYAVCFYPSDHAVQLDSVVCQH